MRALFVFMVLQWVFITPWVSPLRAMGGAFSQEVPLAVRLAPAHGDFDSQTSLYHLHNLSHQNEVWTAELDLRDIQAVWIQQECFSIQGPQLHLQWSFRFKNSFTIRSMSDSLRVLQLRELSLSAGPRVKNRAFLPFSLTGVYSLLHRAMSLEQYKKEIVVTQASEDCPAPVVREYSTLLDSEEARELLIAFMERANRSSNGSWRYSTLMSNCISELFFSLQKAMGFKKRLLSLPQEAHQNLVDYGVLVDGVWNEDYTEL
jgi:hypothetical protein